MYFDPGTGSMLIQIVIGAIPVIAAFFVGFRKKLFGKKEEAKPTESVEGSITDVKKDDGFEDIDDE